MKKILILILFVCVFNSTLFSKDKKKETKYNFGIYANLLLVNHSFSDASFKAAFPSDLDKYDTKSGSGMNFGAFASMEMESFDLQLRFGIQSISAKFSGQK